ncbi:MAG TPA: hypothetical protein ENJ37_02740 [Deltaproteobacteria bacterium]|nr:hypothetical protein [Deltaproteobacteria bacterium]
MNDAVRPVSPGLLLGLCSLIFGIGWAMFIITQHERIHDMLAAETEALMEERFILQPDMEGMDHGGHEEGHMMDEGGHDHGGGAHDHSAHDHGEAAATGDGHDHPAHSDPETAAAHERLTRGHLHAMGLGLVTIALSLVLAFTDAPARVKTVVSAMAGIGGFFYPFAWIVMGFRTPLLGMKGAEESVLPIVAPSVLLVLAALAATAFLVVMGIVKKGLR